MKSLDLTNYMWLHCHRKIGMNGRGSISDEIDFSGLENVGQIEWSLLE